MSLCWGDAVTKAGKAAKIIKLLPWVIRVSTFEGDRYDEAGFVVRELDACGHDADDAA